MQILIESDRLIDERLAPVDWIKEVLGELGIQMDGCTFTNCTFGTTAMLAQEVANYVIKAAQEGPASKFSKKKRLSRTLVGPKPSLPPAS